MLCLLETEHNIWKIPNDLQKFLNFDLLFGLMKKRSIKLTFRISALQGWLSITRGVKDAFRYDNDIKIGENFDESIITTYEKMMFVFDTIFIQMLAEISFVD